MAQKLKEYIAYIPDDGNWDLPAKYPNKEEARKAFLKMLQLDRMPNGAAIMLKPE